jgi:hypothetical protein
MSGNQPRWVADRGDHRVNRAAQRLDLSERSPCEEAGTAQRRSGWSNNHPDGNLLTVGQPARTVAEISDPSHAPDTTFAGIAPPASIGRHVTHHAGGSAGMYRLNTVPAPVDRDKFIVDVEAMRDLARDLTPKVITIGASINLYPHSISELREIADEVGAVLLFDAAHVG